MSRPRPANTLHTQIGQYGMVPLWVLERCKDPRAIQLYALLLAKWANADGRCWPDRKTLLAPALDCSVATIDRAIATLKDAGALQTKLKHRADGAVVGMDFLLVQVDPSLTVTSEEKAGSHLTVTSAKKAASSLPVTGEEKVEGLIVTGESQTSTSDSHYKEEPDPDNQIQERTDLSTAAPPTHTPGLSLEPPAAPKPPTLIDAYHDGYLARFERKPVIHGGKDGKLLKELADQVGEAPVRRMLLAHDGRPGWFFRTPDPFINSTGYTVGVFVSCFNKLQLTQKPAKDAAGVQAQIDMLAEMRARSDAKQQELEQAARAAIVAAAPEVRERIRRHVLAEMNAIYRDIEQRMEPAAFAHSMKSAMVRHVVDTARREQQTPADVVARVAREHAA